LCIGIFFLPQWLWAVGLIAPVAVAALEYARLFGWSLRRARAFTFILIAVCAVSVLSLNTVSVSFEALAMFFCWMAVLFWMFFVPVIIRYKQTSNKFLINALMGGVLIVPLWFSLVEMQRFPRILIGVLIGVWLVDIAGYFFGKKFGKNKLLPEVSPGKTYEGLIGGLIAIAIYVLILRMFYWSSVPFPDWALFILLPLGFVSLGVIGDLFESFLKRCSGVKDSGALLPGHGGLLDRIDSMTSIFPFAFLIMKMFVV
jgi:phosphatidate cytidylyltransferase